MSSLGPSRRTRPTRRRVEKPYAKKAPAVVVEAAPKSSFSSLFSIFTNPFRRAAPAPPPSDEEPENDSSSEESSAEDSTLELEGTVRSRNAPVIGRSDAPLASSESSGSFSGKGASAPLYPKISAPTFSATGSSSSRFRSPFGNPSGSLGAGLSTNGPTFAAGGSATSSAPGDKELSPPRPPANDYWQSPNTNSEPGRPTFRSAFPPFNDPRPHFPAASLDPNSPYTDVLEFLDSKARRGDGRLPLNEMEVLQLTEQLKKNATQGAREILDSISLSVPSAALMAEYGRRTADSGGSPSRMNANGDGPSFGTPLRKPFLAPEAARFNYSPASAPGTPERKRRRHMYTGVGQSPARATSSPRARPSPAPGSRLKLERSFGDDSTTSGSNKKRLIGDAGIPVASGSGSGSFESTTEREDAPGPSSQSTQSTSFTSTFGRSFESTQESSQESASTSSVPFPSVSPVKAATSAATASGSNGPFSRPIPNMFPGTRRGNVMPAPVPSIPRPEAPKHPSPLRRVNMADVSSSSEGDSRNGTPERPAPPQRAGRSSASAAILDIVMDDANVLPKVKSRSKEDNPFDDLMPAPRVSTPVRRVSQRFPPRKSAESSQDFSPSVSASSSANTGRGIFSNNILDQIDSTAPRASTQPEEPTDLASSRPEPSQPARNLFASSSTTFSPSPFTALMGSVTSLNTTTSTSTTSVPSIFADSHGGKLAKTKEAPSTSIASGSTSSPFGRPNAAQRARPSPFDTPVDPRSSAKLPPLAPSSSAKGKEPEIVVLDDDEDDIQITSPPAKFSKGRSTRRTEEVVVEEVMEEDELADYASDVGEQVNDEEAGGEYGGPFGRSSRTPTPEKSPKKHIEHATSVEEVDEHAQRGTSPEKSPEKNSASRPNGRFGGSISIPNGVVASSSFKASRSPVIPSPLRQVSLPPDDDFKLDHDREMAAPDDENKPFGRTTVGKPTLAPPRIPGPKFASFVAPGSSASITSFTKTNGGEEDSRQRALGLPLDGLPPYNLGTPTAFGSVISPLGKEDLSAKKKAVSLASEDLPTFSLRGPVPVASSSTFKLSSFSAASTVAPVSIPQVAPPKSFDWAAAGIKAPSATAEWTCTTCSCQNKFDHDVCIVCDAARPKSNASSAASSKPPTPLVPSPAASAASGSFDWAAAGLKPPPAAGAMWTCSGCFLQNQNSASKCTVCDAAKPGSSKSGSASPLFGAGSTPPTSAVTPPGPPAGVITGFNWGAAGMKAPTTNAGDWTCSVCMVSNPAAKTKCLSCESSR